MTPELVELVYSYAFRQIEYFGEKDGVWGIYTYYFEIIPDLTGFIKNCHYLN